MVVIGWYCIVWSGWFCLNCCSQCNHAFACSLAATMHTHTAPPTSYCTIASVPFSHCFCLLSPPGTDKPCCSGTQGGLLTSSLYNVLQVLKGEGLRSQRPLLSFIVSLDCFVCSYGDNKDKYGWLLSCVGGCFFTAKDK